MSAASGHEGSVHSTTPQLSRCSRSTPLRQTHQILYPASSLVSRGSLTTLFQSPGRPRQAPSQSPQQSAPSAPRSPVPRPVLSVPLPKSLPPALPPQYHAGRA
jgi:hypothetical protein